ncbi:MAG: NAD(P)(+) transhydrogenase (Re/Si-specific) subunit beta, partial [Gammaproteobacteria bacterium]
MSFLSPEATKWLIDVAYFATAFLFIMGLKRMASPVTARSGIVWAGGGMVIATLITFLEPSSHGAALSSTNLLLVVLAIGIGGGLAWVSGQRVAMTDMPQMIALYNGMGGGAAAAIAAVELYQGGEHTLVVSILAVLGGLIGGVSFSGSGIAYGKLQGLIKKSYRFSGQQALNL